MHSERPFPVHRSRQKVPEAPEKRPWTPPEVRELPRLTDLTLQTGDAVGGGIENGSTVF